MTLKKRINAFVKEIAKREGGKIELDAPQIREVLKCIATMQAEYHLTDDLDFLDGFFDEYRKQPNIQRIAKRNVKAREK